MIEIPQVNVTGRAFAELNPDDPTAPYVKPDGFDERVAEYTELAPRLEAQVADLPEGLLEHRATVASLEKMRLFHTVAELREAVAEGDYARHDELSDKVTQQSLELFGEIDTKTAYIALRAERDEFAGLKGYRIDKENRDRLVEFMDGILEHDTSNGQKDTDFAQEQQQVRREMRRAFLKKYGDAIDLSPLNSIKEHLGRLTPQDYHTELGRMFAWLARNDHKDWKGWEIKDVHEEKARAWSHEQQVFVPLDAPEGYFNLPRKIERLKAHETLVHCRRGLWGEALDISTQPNYDRMEEGVGSFIETLVLRKPILGAVEAAYYIPALALGVIGGRPHTRSELTEMYRWREQLVSERDKMPPPGMQDTHLRILGRLGVGSGIDPRDDDRVQKQAIFTYGSVYYDGYRRIGRWVAAALDQGHSAEEILDYMLCAHFNPCVPEDVKYVNEKLQGNEHGIKPIGYITLSDTHLQQ